MARLVIAVALATSIVIPASADARSSRPGTAHRHVASPKAQAPRPSTDPIALALKLAEQYWHGTPACGTPTIVTSPNQLPNADYEAVTSPEPNNSVVEMWTEVQNCKITINASLWGSWHQDGEFFQWFCDSMTHEVGHLFGHPDGGQTDPTLITYPLLDETSPNFNSVPQCRNVTLHYGSQEIRNEKVIRGSHR